MFLAYSLSHVMCIFLKKFLSFQKNSPSFFFSVCRFLQKIFITLRENKRKRPERCLPPPQNASMMTTRVSLLLLLSRMKRKRRLGRKEKRKKRREGKENPVGNLIIKITRTHRTTKKQKKKGRGQIRRKEKRSHFHLHLLFLIITVLLITSLEEEFLLRY